MQRGLNRIGAGAQGGHYTDLVQGTWLDPGTKVRVVSRGEILEILLKSGDHRMYLREWAGFLAGAVRAGICPERQMSWCW